MTKGYWVAFADISDPEGYKAYVAENAKAFRKYGARFLARGGKGENPEGTPRSRVVVIEFTDLQCPYCGHFANHTFPRLKAAYVDSGKIRYVSRDLPLPMHAHAETAAVAARCAGEQGRLQLRGKHGLLQ